MAEVRLPACGCRCHKIGLACAVFSVLCTGEKCVCGCHEFNRARGLPDAADFEPKS